MPKKRAHEISDSEEEIELQASSSTVSPSKVGSTPRDPSQRFPKKAAVSNDEDDEQDGNKSTAMEVVPFDIDADVGGSFIFFGEVSISSSSDRITKYHLLSPITFYVSCAQCKQYSRAIVK